MRSIEKYRDDYFGTIREIEVIIIKHDHKGLSLIRKPDGTEEWVHWTSCGDTAVCIQPVGDKLSR